MIIKVDTDLPQRLDRYLSRLSPNFTHGIIERSLRLKHITVNKQKAKASLRVQSGDEIWIADRLEPQVQEEGRKVWPLTVVKLAHKILNEYKIYDTSHFLAINKPAGLATQGGSKISLSINDALCYLNEHGNNLRLVHRLDKETSGVLLIAKDYASSVKLSTAFQDKHIKKIYYAIIIGKPAQSEGEISGFIAKSRGGIYEIMQADPAGKHAITHYKVLTTLNKGLSLVEFIPLTGRMHQLRFHAKLLGCPIAGDLKYGSPASIGVSRQMLLHAKTVILSDQIFGEKVIIDAKIPNYFEKFLTSQ